MFTQPEKYVLQFKHCNVWAIFGCISEQFFFLYTLELPNDAAQNSGTSLEDTSSEQSETARTKAQQHCSRGTPTHAPHST